MNAPSTRTRQWLAQTLAIGLLLFPLSAFAASGDLYMASGNLWLSDSTVIHGQTVSIYASVSNDTPNDLLGSVKFVNQTTGAQIGSDQAISVLAENTDTVFVDWTPTAGTYTIVATVYPWDTSADDNGNNSLSLTTTVDYDYDSDGVGNAQDPNDDNDDAVDSEDAFPYDAAESKDSDQDGIGNNADTDDDNDGIPDASDALPENAGETLDADGDEIGDNEDPDDDNDGIEDSMEITAQDPTDPTNPDSDGDGLLDGPGAANASVQDVFPNDPDEWSDTDGDDIGDNEDSDDDNDGIPDEEDLNATNAAPMVWVETSVQTDENGVEWAVWDASDSYDPEGTAVTYQWFDGESTLLSEEAVLTLPAVERARAKVLVVTDESGESRMLELNLLGAMKTMEAMGLALIAALVISLAILLYFKYTPSAPVDAKRASGSKKPSLSKRSKKA